jgi:hypothetical protein
VLYTLKSAKEEYEVWYTLKSAKEEYEVM